MQMTNRIARLGMTPILVSALFVGGCRSAGTQAESAPARTPPFAQKQAPNANKAEEIQPSGATAAGDSGVVPASYEASSVFGASCSH
jgi:hypothetical protein